MEAVSQLDTAKSGATLSGQSEPKRSAGAADKKAKKDTVTSAPGQGKKTAAGKNAAAAGKSKVTAKKSSPKTATENSNQDLANRMVLMENMLAKIAAAIPSISDDTPSTSANVTDRHGDHYDEFDEACAGSVQDGQYYAFGGGQAAAAARPFTDAFPGPGEAGGIAGEDEGDNGNEFSVCKQDIPVLAAKFAVHSGVGEPVDNELANSTAYLIAHPLEEKMLEDTAAKYPAPSNCTNLDTPKVNAPIWDNLPQHTRSRDVKLQRVQKSLTKGLSALIQSFPTSQLTEVQHDALALLCNANFELNCLRKELIKPDMASTYSHLCKPNTPVSKFLFGDELGKRMKDMKEEQRAASGAVKSTKPMARTPYHPYRGSGYAKRQYRSAGWTSNPNNRAPAGRPIGGGPSRSFLGQRTQWGHKQPPPHTQTRPPQTQHRGAPQRKK